MLLPRKILKLWRDQGNFAELKSAEDHEPAGQHECKRRGRAMIEILTNTYQLWNRRDGNPDRGGLAWRGMGRFTLALAELRND